MSKLKSISTAMWSDLWIETLSPLDKLLFIYLITNEKNNMLGIYELSLRKVSFETGIPLESIEKGLEGFERVKKIKYIDNYVFLLNFLKNQKFNLNMKKSAINSYNDLPNKLKISGISFIDGNIVKGFETLCKGLGMFTKIEDESEDESESKSKSEDTPEIKIPGEDKKLKKSIKKPDTLFKSFRKKFEEKYESITESEYYWAAKDSVAINQLIEKVKHAYKTSHLKPVENPTDEQMILGFEYILNRAVKDKWICANFEPGIINSKFNNLKINETTSKNDWSSKVMRMGQGLIDLEEQLRNDS